MRKPQEKKYFFLCTLLDGTSFSFHLSAFFFSSLTIAKKPFKLALLALPPWHEWAPPSPQPPSSKRRRPEQKPLHRARARQEAVEKDNLVLLVWGEENKRTRVSGIFLSALHFFCGGSRQTLLTRKPHTEKKHLGEICMLDPISAGSHDSLPKVDFVGGVRDLSCCIFFQESVTLSLLPF